MSRAAGPAQYTGLDMPAAQPPDPAGSARPVDSVALRHHLTRLCRAPQAPWLHAEVARRMAERLPLFRQAPRAVIDWWAPISASSSVLATQAPSARVQATWPDGIAVPDQSLWSRLRRAASGAGTPVPDSTVPEGAADLLWSNMGLHWSADPPGLLRRWRRLVRVDGFVLFSTLGPGTLLELQRLYRKLQWGSPMASMIDMHDLGDMLVGSGFADPVMDQETLTLHWSDVGRLLDELRSLGGNADPQRQPGLRTPRWRDRWLREVSQAADAAGRISMSFEVVYGHAFCPPPRAVMSAETRIGVEDLRAMARRRS